MGSAPLSWDNPLLHVRRGLPQVLQPAAVGTKNLPETQLLPLPPPFPSLSLPMSQPFALPLECQAGWAPKGSFFKASGSRG